MRCGVRYFARLWALTAAGQAERCGRAQRRFLRGGAFAGIVATAAVQERGGRFLLAKSDLLREASRGTTVATADQQRKAFRGTRMWRSPGGGERPAWQDRGRDEDYSAPPAQIRTGPIKASGSYLGCLAAKRTAAQRARDEGFMVSGGNRWPASPSASRGCHPLARRCQRRLAHQLSPGAIARASQPARYVQPSAPAIPTSCAPSAT